MPTRNLIAIAVCLAASFVIAPNSFAGECGCASAPARTKHTILRRRQNFLTLSLAPVVQTVPLVAIAQPTLLTNASIRMQQSTQLSSMMQMARILSAAQQNQNQPTLADQNVSSLVNASNVASQVDRLTSKVDKLLKAVEQLTIIVRNHDEKLKQK